MRILVLGHQGLLGNMVRTFLSKQENLKVLTVDHVLRWPSSNFKQAVVETHADYIVNCIGAIHQKTSEFTVNYELPRWLGSLNCRIIHPGTDCESDEDEYGISKKTARDFIVMQGGNTRIIKTSIIGPELNTNYSLFSWFLSNDDSAEVKGFTDQYWNGNTTLAWANVCNHMIHNWEKYPVETIITTDCISKYELLCTINNVFNRNITIHPSTSMERHKCLSGTRITTIEQQLHQLKQFMYENN